MKPKAPYFGITLHGIKEEGTSTFESLTGAALRLQGQTGFNAVEIWMDGVGKSPCCIWPEQYDAALLKKMRAFLSHFEYKGVHLPFACSDYTSINPYVARLAKEQVLLAIKLAGKLGADYCVGHARFNYLSQVSEDEAFRRYAAVWREFADLAAEGGVRYCLETCEFIDTPAKFSRAYRETNHPNFRLTLDAGKVVWYTKGNEGLFDWLDREALPFVGSTHLWDYDPSGGSRRILPGNGRCDIRGVVSRLLASGYAGSYNLETGGTFEEEKTAILTLKGYLGEK